MFSVLDINDLSKEQCDEIFDRASCHSEERSDEESPSHPSVIQSEAKDLSGKGVALIFEKPSTRTRNSMEMAVAQLGGHPVYIQGAEIGFDVRESIEDITVSLAQYHSVVCARVNEHSVLERMAACDVVPVVNMLSEVSHPLQALADMLTIQQEFGNVAGKKVAYIGDPNNVAYSLAKICEMYEMEFVVATPDTYAHGVHESAALVTDDVTLAAKNADVLYTDVWVSMGDEGESGQRLKDFEQYSITPELVSAANDKAIVMHCLPAHPGQEISADVIDSEASRIWPQAQNRMHSARGLLSLIASTSSS